MPGPRRIGVFKFKNIGDVLLMTPALRGLRETFPDAEITAVVNDFTAPMLENNPHINRTLAFPRRKKNETFFQRIRIETDFLKKIRELNFDATVDFTSGDRATFYSVFSGANTRAAFRGKWSKFSWKNAAYNSLIPRLPKTTHQVERDLELVRKSLGASSNDRSLCLRFSDAAMNWAREQLAPFQQQRIVHVHPVARWLYKCWDDQRMAEIIDWLQNERGAKVVVTCGPEQREMQRAKTILGFCRTQPLNFLGTISLQQLGALSASSRCFFGVDTAPMHVAASTNVPVIALFGPTDEDWHPWCKEKIVLRRPCPKKSEREKIGDSGPSLIDVTVPEAQEALLKFLR